jgi:multiple sugar transport system ATP-binding protein
MTLGDRIVIMKDGVVQQIGTPQEVFDHPANKFVAGFIGMPQMNFFDAELVMVGDKYAAELGGIQVVLSDEKQENLKRNDVKPQSITLGIRPEHIALLGTDGPVLHGTVDVSEMMGSAIHLHVNVLGQDTVIIVQTMDISGQAKESFEMGQSIAFTFGGNMVHVFDHETGKNLEV